MEESCLPESKNDRKGCAKGLWECRHLSGILRESWAFRPVQPCSVVCQLLAPSNASPGKGADGLCVFDLKAWSGHTRSAPWGGGNE